MLSCYADFDGHISSIQKSSQTTKFTERAYTLSLVCFATSDKDSLHFHSGDSYKILWQSTYFPSQINM